MIVVRGRKSAGDKNRRSFTDIPSCPDDVFVRRDFKILLTSFSFTTVEMK